MGQRLCYRLGPGRLPFASRNDVGGGIAMAATGLLAIVLWLGSGWLLNALGITNSTLGFFFGVGLVAIPIAVPTSFVSGTLLWRKLDQTEDRQRYGAIFGAITALSSLVVGAFGPVLLLSISNIVRGEMAIIEAATFSVLLLPISVLFAIIAAGWLVIPLGAFGGWYHERAKALS